MRPPTAGRSNVVSESNMEKFANGQLKSVDASSE